MHSRTWRAVLAEHGVEVTVAEYADHWIRRGCGIGEFIVERRLAGTVDTYLPRKKELYFAEIATCLRPMDGALDLLESLRGRTRLALVTSGRHAMVTAALARLGMSDFFETMVTFESVTRPKPHPEPFLLIAEMLRLPPSRCVALDDAEKGIVSAAGAGMPAVAVPNEHTRDHDFSKASLVVGSLRDVTFETLDGLVSD